MCSRFTLPLLLISGTCLALTVCLAFPSLSRASVHPFVFGGGQATRTEKTDKDQLLNDVTTRDQTSVWEAGAGLRITPPAIDEAQASERAGGQPEWEVRARYGRGGGNLPGTVVHVPRAGFTTKESFEYSDWTLGITFLTRIQSWLGGFAGPGIQSVHFKADRNWDGPIPNFCSRCGNGKDEATTRYGFVELGARLRPLTQPLGIELYWIPGRRLLSTSHKVRTDAYFANFGSLDRSFGARLSYDF